MINLDVRDRSFWYREAQLRMLENQIKAIQAVRIAMAKDSDYQAAITDLKGQRNEILIGKDKVIRENWKDLKKKKRG